MKLTLRLKLALFALLIFSFADAQKTIKVGWKNEALEIISYAAPTGTAKINPTDINRKDDIVRLEFTGTFSGKFGSFDEDHIKLIDVGHTNDLTKDGSDFIYKINKSGDKNRKAAVVFTDAAGDLLKGKYIYLGNTEHGDQTIELSYEGDKVTGKYYIAGKESMRTKFDLTKDIDIIFLPPFQNTFTDFSKDEIKLVGVAPEQLKSTEDNKYVYKINKIEHTKEAGLIIKTEDENNLFIFGDWEKSGQKIIVKWEADNLNYGYKNESGEIINPEDLDPKKDIDILFDPGFQIKFPDFKKEHVSISGRNEGDLNTKGNDKYSFRLQGIDKQKTYTLKFTDGSPSPLPGKTLDFGKKEGVAGNKPPIKNNNESQFYSLLKSSGDFKRYVDSEFQSKLITEGKRYDLKNDKAYFFIDPNGEQIGERPVNIDQDTRIIFFVIVPIDKFDSYVLDDDGDYSPDDLPIRPYKETDISSQSDGITNESYAIKTFVKGPFTSTKVNFTLKTRGEDEINIIKTYSARINKTYALQVGVSFVYSGLRNPSYSLLSLNNGTSTIYEDKGSARNFVTFNVIWYWQKSFRNLRNEIKEGSEITTGRDVLKNPSFFQRFNPTFGLTLNRNFSNYFLGVNFEFARGGGIIGGYHWGQVNKLVLPYQGFNVNESVFTGAESDIKTTQVWQGSWFIGITLDTRIFGLFRP